MILKHQGVSKQDLSGRTDGWTAGNSRHKTIVPSTYRWGTNYLQNIKSEAEAKAGLGVYALKDDAGEILQMWKMRGPDGGMENRGTCEGDSRGGD